MVTVVSDLTLQPNKRIDVPHFHHRLGKVVEEQLLITGIAFHQLHCLLHIPSEQRFVWGEKPFVPQQQLEVCVVESDRGGNIQGRYVVISPGSWTLRFQVSVVCPLKSCIRLAVAILVVQPLSEAHTSGYTNGVPPCIIQWTRSLISN